MLLCASQVFWFFYYYFSFAFLALKLTEEMKDCCCHAFLCVCLAKTFMHHRFVSRNTFLTALVYCIIWTKWKGNCDLKVFYIHFAELYKLI